MSRHDRYRRRALLAVSLLTALLVGLGAGAARAQPTGDGEWIGTWSASPQAVWEADFFAPVGIPRSLRDQTVRQIARVSLGGSQVRVELSNEYGEHPLVIGAAHVALAGKGAAIVPGSDRALTFGGSPSVTIPPGAPVLSDPVELTVRAARQRRRQPLSARDHADHDLAQRGRADRLHLRPRRLHGRDRLRARRPDRPRRASS